MCALASTPCVGRAPLPRIRACLFDMDGLLLDSEDKYTECTNAVLAQYGRPNLPWSIKAQLQGRPGPEAGAIFQAWARLPIGHDEFTAAQTARQRELFPTCRPLPGVEALLGRLAATSQQGGGGAEGQQQQQQQQGDNRDNRVYLALATSSRRETFEYKTNHLGHLFQAFPPECQVLGDDPRIPPGRGKPCGDIYLLALETINAGIRQRREQEGSDETEVRPDECLVLEDSVPGVEAGRRAGMQVLWVPHPGLLGEYRGKENEVLAGRSGMVHSEMRGEGDQSDMMRAPGELEDGWASMVDSLEEFPYEVFGIKA